MNSLKAEKHNSLNNRLVQFNLIAVALCVATLAVVPRARGQDASAPEVPAALEVPDGNVVKFHAYGVGVQIYVWTVTAAGGGWVFQAPEAVLFGSPEEHGVVGQHYAGPTWQSNSGSKVMGARIAGVTVDPTAIPWLLLHAVSSQGPGVFNNVSYIQRVNTVGGLAPSVAGAFAGQVARVPYLAEYFFFEAQD